MPRRASLKSVQFYTVFVRTASLVISCIIMLDHQGEGKALEIVPHFVLGVQQRPGFCILALDRQIFLLRASRHKLKKHISSTAPRRGIHAAGLPTMRLLRSNIHTRISAGGNIPRSLRLWK